jgi:hypothetical protein
LTVGFEYSRLSRFYLLERHPVAPWCASVGALGGVNLCFFALMTFSS